MHILVFTDALNDKKLSIDSHFNGMISRIHMIVIPKSKYLHLSPSVGEGSHGKINSHSRTCVGRNRHDAGVT